MLLDWKAIKELHVNKKMEEIMGTWFSLDLVYADKKGKVQNDFQNKAYHFYSPLFKAQMSKPFGLEWLEQDVEKALNYFKHHEDHVYEFETYFPHVHGVATKVLIDDEMVGTVIAYPVLKAELGAKELKELSKFMSDNGLPEDSEELVKKLQKLNDESFSYLKEMIEIVSEEAKTYHEEIIKREDRISELNSELSNKYRYHNLIGKSKKMQQVYNLLAKISSSESSILVQGQNGTGKELVAKAIHYNSPRKDAVFMAVNCSAFNDNLLDSELFGHVKGSFTGAIKDKKGVFETANGGTLFLDEIGDTSLSMQVKLLRVLQESTFLPVGATVPKKVNVRIIAATNKPLKEMIAKGEFREDLYYRINVINVTLPSLKERSEDIPLLMDYFLQKRCQEAGVPLKTFAKKTLEKLLDYHWPGNVRELENEIERLVVIAGDDKSITPDILSPRILEASESGRAQSVGGSGIKGIDTSGSLKQALEELEIIMIREGLKRCGYNKSKLSKELGISRAGLIMKVDKYGLDKRAQKKAAGE